MDFAITLPFPSPHLLIRDVVIKSIHYASQSTPQSFLIITLCYIAAAILGLWVFRALAFQVWLNLLVADLAATLFI